jgi:hypothetical protein
MADNEPDAFQAFDPQNLDDSLRKLHAEAVARAREECEWYQKNRGPKKSMSQALRILTIIFFGLAGLVPLLTAAHLTPDLKILSMVVATSQLGYIFAAFATALIGFDKFMGFSSGWSRYMVAQLDIKTAISDFQASWVLASACLDHDADEKACGKKRLELIKAFLAKVNDIVGTETRGWIAEFQNSITLLEKKDDPKPPPGNNNNNKKPTNQNQNDNGQEDVA